MRFTALCLFMLGTLLLVPDPGYAQVEAELSAFLDDEGCLLCHKYPKMARITKEGVRRTYTVIPEVYSGTVHRNVACSDCHKEIKQLPHREVVEGVTCSSECHSVVNPATGKNFSHKPIVDMYEKSVHARSKLAEGHDQDKPYCVTCHTNPVYNPGEDAPPRQVLQRCIICHEDQKFVVSWYRHTSRRIREVRRSSEEIVALCSACHGDEKLVARHLQAAASQGRELGPKYAYAVESYKESFHGKVTSYGFEKAANCLDCHADQDMYYLSVHNIRPSRDSQAPTSQQRKLQTCQRCHVYADDNYAQLDPHPSIEHGGSAFLHYAELIYNWMSYIVITSMVGFALFETIGRRRDGVAWIIRQGSSWRRSSKRGRLRRD